MLQKSLFCNSAIPPLAMDMRQHTKQHTKPCTHDSHALPCPTTTQLPGAAFLAVVALIFLLLLLISEGRMPGTHSSQKKVKVVSQLSHWGFRGMVS